MSIVWWWGSLLSWKMRRTQSWDFFFVLARGQEQTPGGSSCHLWVAYVVDRGKEFFHWKIVSYKTSLRLKSKILFRNGGSPTLNCSSVLNSRTSPFLSGLPCLEVATLRLCPSVGYESPYGSPGELAAPVQPCHTADRVPSSGLRLAFLLGLQFRLIINVRSFDNHPWTLWVFLKVV